MPSITLPDNSTRDFDQTVTVAEVAASIGAGLAKATLAGEVDGVLVDASYPIDGDARLRLITAKDPEALEVLRHSTAHLMAQAVQRLFPKAQVTIGPVIEDGFYYDFDVEPALTPEDQAAIEKTMKAIIKENLPVTREVLTKAEAVALFASMGERYKVELIEAIPEGEDLSVYRQGEFVDLCRGPHVPRTGMLGAFKLTKLAGAYWRGDSKNKMLQRVYGTAWASKQDLALHLERLEQAKARDHRVLAAKMGLCHFQDIAPGEVFWHKNGWILNRLLRDHIRRMTEAYAYDEINTPILLDVSLWEKSGHCDKYNDNMFHVPLDKSGEQGKSYAVKPMSCPCHVQVFNQGIKSYRDLPVRYAEFGCCHRYEPSGTLHGLMRVRGFVQDDAHIFCTPEQIASESMAVIKQTLSLYKDFGFEDVSIKLSTRPEQRVGDDAAWDQAEQTLEAVLNDSGLDWTLLPGEGAFYGPKIEFAMRDCLGRVWQCGTLQLDFFLPQRLGASYIDAAGEKQCPVMLHRACLGSIERFMGILLEHTAGHLPLWLAPLQLVVTGISEKHNAAAEDVATALKKAGLRVQCDLRNEKIGFKIREHSIARVPYMVVLGDHEVEHGTVTLRPSQGKQIAGLNLECLIQQLQNEVTSKGEIRPSATKNEVP